MPHRHRIRADRRTQSVRREARAASARESQLEPEHDREIEQPPLSTSQGDARSAESTEPEPPLPCVIVEQLKNDCCFLFNHGIGNPEMELFAEVFKQNTTVTELNLGNNRIGDSGVLALFYPLRTDACLTVLHLHRNEIGDAGSAVLAEAMKNNTTLRELYLGSNQIGDIGAEAFAESLKLNATICKLSLARNIIRDSGVESISEALKVNTGLSELSLDFNLITEEGVSALTALNHCNKTLRKVTLVGNMVRDKEEEPEPPKLAVVTGCKEVKEEEEYTVHAAACNFTGLGISLHMVNDEFIIDDIQAGFVQEWNKENPPEVRVELGDCIVEVNGIRGESLELLTTCQEAENLTLVLKRKHTFKLALHTGHRVFIDGYRDRPEVNGQRGVAVKWFDPVKRWKVKLEDGSVLMCRMEELEIDKSQIVAGGYKVGDLILSRLSCTLNSGAQLSKGNVGMVVAPVTDPRVAANMGDMGLIVKFSMGTVMISASSIMPKDARLGPAEFQITLDPEGSGGLGASVQLPEDRSSLMIKSITPGGLIEDWNNRCDPDAVVRVGCRIVEVNGYRGDARLLVTECKQKPVQTLATKLTVAQCEEAIQELDPITKSRLEDFLEARMKARRTSTPVRSTDESGNAASVPSTGRASRSRSKRQSRSRSDSSARKEDAKGKRTKETERSKRGRSSSRSSSKRSSSSSASSDPKRRRKASKGRREQSRRGRR